MNTKSKASKSKPAAKRKAAKSGRRSATNKPAPQTKPKATTAATAPAARANSKLATLTAMLRLKEGATIDQLVKATGWQPHSVRGAISGSLKKKMGLTITSSKDGDVRIYRIES